MKAVAKNSSRFSRISVHPEVCGGVPCIRGTRVPVSVVLSSLSEGLTPEQVHEHFPNVTVEDVLAALAWAAHMARRKRRSVAA